MTAAPFERVAGLASIFVAVGGVAYAILFAYIVEGAPEWIYETWYFLLMVGGIAAIPVFAAIYGRLREVDPGFALTALILALMGAFGGIIHGAYNLGVNITPPNRGPAAPPGLEEISKGVLRYAVAGLAFGLIGWLILRGARLPRALGYIALAAGATLVFVYIGRLYDFINADDKVTLIPPFLYGFILHPAWYLWLGWVLWKPPASASIGRG